MEYLAVPGEKGVKALCCHMGTVEGEDRLAGLKATPPPAQPSVQESTADTLIVAHTCGNLLDVSTQEVADAGHLVDKGDLGCQEGVGGVLDHLRGVYIGDDNGRTQWEVELRSSLRHHTVR